MTGQLNSLFGNLYAAVGPGLWLAAALPLFLIALVLVVRAGMRRPPTA